jgi:hypothetical protein
MYFTHVFNVRSMPCRQKDACDDTKGIDIHESISFILIWLAPASLHYLIATCAVRCAGYGHDMPCIFSFFK